MANVVNELRAELQMVRASAKHYRLILLAVIRGLGAEGVLRIPTECVRLADLACDVSVSQDAATDETVLTCSRNGTQQAAVDVDVVENRILFRINGGPAFELTSDIIDDGTPLQQQLNEEADRLQRALLGLCAFPATV